MERKIEWDRKGERGRKGRGYEERGQMEKRMSLTEIGR